MKQLSISFFALAAVIYLSSCNGMMEMKKIDMVQLNQIEDSVLKNQIIPHTTSIHTLQDDDFSKVTIIIRNTQLYGNKEAIQPAGVRMGVMLLNILGKDASISKGSLVVTQVDDNQNKIPEDGITADMKIDSLKKVMFSAK